MNKNGVKGGRRRRRKDDTLYIKVRIGDALSVVSDKLER